jgi:acylphosphatase
MRRAHVRVHGQVQGVFFRVETRDRARSLGISGWVRNLPDGAVEAVFEGDDPQVESMVEWCRRGPRGADVQNVDVAWVEPRGEAGFAVR